MGKSSSGKDTLYRELLRDPALQLQKVVMYTTRPPRDKEVDGREYYFTSEPMFHAMCKAGKVIEHRVYETVQGPWYYYTADDGQIDLRKHNYLIIGTLDVYTALRDHFGPAHVVPILMEVDDGERLSRALRRERRQKHPHYEEMCRRFLADQADFSEEKIQAAGIRRRFSNASIAICKEEVRRFIAGTENPAGERAKAGEKAKAKTEEKAKAKTGDSSERKRAPQQKGKFLDAGQNRDERRHHSKKTHPENHLNDGQQHKKEKTELNGSGLAFNRTKYKNRKYRKGGQHG